MKHRLYRVSLRQSELFVAPVSIRIARRNVHTTKRTITSTPTAPIEPVAAELSQPVTNNAQRNAPLSILPLSTVLRTYMITSLSSLPFFLGLTVSTLQRMLSLNSAFFHPERNPILRTILKHTFYAQFCAGENGAEVSRTMKSIKDTGYSGVILEYALEVLESKDQPTAEQTSCEIQTWRKGVLESVAVTGKGDYVGLKWSGLGVEALRRLKANEGPTPEMKDTILEVCDASAAKGVRLLPGAEMESMNGGIDEWTLDAMRRYNRDGRVVMYNTYQAYLRSTPEKLAWHLERAKREGFVLGTKVVRGAYLAAEPRGRVWGTKEETDKCYDGLVESLLRRRWNEVLQAPDAMPDKGFPKVSLVIASHNLPSVRKAMAVRNLQARTGEERIKCAYAQLYGMADDVSAELVHASKAAVQQEVACETVDRPVTLKCATWGTLGECLNFLLRRAAENKDAAGRTDGTRKAMGKEISRRLRTAFGLA